MGLGGWRRHQDQPPFIGPGDYFAAQAAYTEGAVRYISNTNGGSGVASFSGGGSGIAGATTGAGSLVGGTLGYGFWSDAVYCGNAATVANPTGGAQPRCRRYTKKL